MDVPQIVINIYLFQEKMVILFSVLRVAQELEITFGEILILWVPIRPKKFRSGLDVKGVSTFRCATNGNQFLYFAEQNGYPFCCVLWVAQ